MGESEKENLKETEGKKDQAGLGSPKQRKRTVCIVGHKNPDTDSICSAIAYSYLKNQLGDPYNYVAARAGLISAETQYVLERFQAKQPVLLENIGTRVKDMEIRKVEGVRSNISLKRAWTLMQEQNIFTLPITNSKNKLKGLITINDIAKSYMEEYSSSIVSVAKTPYKNILETLDAEMIVGDPDGFFDKGKVVIAAANPDVMENYIEEHDMVILGNRYEGQLCAIEMQAGCIVVCLGAPVSRTIKRLAAERGCTIIVTPLDTYAVARLINQSMPVEFFMQKEENLLTFRLSDYTESIRDTMSKKRYRDFPILDKGGYYVGMISRRNLLGVRKRGLILVDHNEVSQAVDNVLDAEIMEIIDHHRLGSLETINPVYFRNQPVGCTSTIIYQMFRENCIEIPANIAGLMCSAILSDTLIFRSPTCTPMDVDAARALASIAGIECESFAKKMFAAGSDLSTKTPEEICYQDFKTFELGDMNVGVGQLTSMSAEELKSIKTRILPFLKNMVEKKEVDMVCFMLTNILEEGSDLICFGNDDEDIIDAAFHEKLEDGCVYLNGVVSRKKQLVPSLMSGISQITGG
ncbi:MAG: putative manganese-dependent inorganic diphosphatase [Clostridiales bacterium]|nr:putative manganese-dependent inorganic diphosphatase [Clostridiales bacterium]